MFGALKYVVFALVIQSAAATAVSAHGRFEPAGPAWYIDDNAIWRSIRSDWRGLQGPPPRQHYYRRHRYADTR